jgi:hypothetical protein
MVFRHEGAYLAAYSSTSDEVMVRLASSVSMRRVELSSNAEDGSSSSNTCGLRITARINAKRCLSRLSKAG